MSELWERQEGETTKAYAAFCVYRDLGSDRSLSKAAESLGKSKPMMEQWSSKYDWVKRAEAWDDEQDRIARKKNTEEIVRMRKRHAKIAQAALEKVSAALEYIDPENISNSDIARLMDTASKLERLSRGDVGDVIEERDGGKAVNPVQIYIPDNNRGRDKDDFSDLEV